MLRAALLTLLATALSVSLQAQHGGMASSGHAASAHGAVSSGSHLGGQVGHPAGSPQRGISHSAISTRHRRNGGYGVGLWPYDLPYYGSENEVAQTAPEQEPEVLGQAEPEMRPRPLPKAQVIEVPGSAIAAKPLPPTIFVLTSGERLETQRFLLTANTLSVSVHRTDRTIPVEMVDLDATEAANRERGIDLRIPSDRNEVSLRF